MEPFDGYNPSGKFQRVSSGEMMLPAHCVSCGTVENPDGFVDTKVDAEFFGIVYFCANCAFELTTVFPEAPYHTMRNRILALETDIVAKDATIASLERAMDGLTSLRLSNRGLTVDDGLSDVEPVAELAAADLPTVEPLILTGDTDSEPTEPVTDDRPLQPARPKRRNDPIVNLDS